MATVLKSPRQINAVLREAERELDAARMLSDVNAAARKLMQAKRALKAQQTTGTA